MLLPLRALVWWCACLGSASVDGHITMVPNSGAEAGTYFATALKIPHGHTGMYTSKLVLRVPHGVLTVRPEVPHGWNVTIQHRQLSEDEYYSSHGRQITTAPDLITWNAETHESTLYTDHLMLLHLQLKLGCTYTDPSSASLWQGEHTLWFQVEQHSSYEGNTHSEEVYLWTGTQQDDGASSPPWSATTAPERPCPYLFFYAGNRCTTAEGTTTGITNWFGTTVPTVPDQEAVTTVEHVKSLLNEAVLNAREEAQDGGGAAGMATQARVDDVAAVAILALVVSLLLAGILTGLCCFRIVDRTRFSTVVAAACPVTHTLPVVKTTTTAMPDP